MEPLPTSPTPEPLDYGDFFLHLAVDLVFTGVLLFMFFRRHRRRDLVMSFACFNVGFFVVLSVIFSVQIGLAVAFGLFAVLSIVRLRSEPYNNIELGYYFVALALALVNGIGLEEVEFALLLNAILVATTAAMDRPTFVEGTERRRVTLDAVYRDDDSVRKALGQRIDSRVVNVSISEIDYVRETTELTALIASRPRDSFRAGGDA
jgi:Domain of unknown function (DUF4956)